MANNETVPLARGRGHMVEAIAGGMGVAQLRSELQAAHDYLAEAARGVASQLRGTEIARWGSDVKRVTVPLREPLPALVSRRSSHNFVEVVNQCATLERLIDALDWAETALPGYVVHGCHPTTSSTTNAHDHDLVLTGDVDRLPAYFEVSDILSGVVKERNDLSTLGVPESADATSVWPDARLFLVVSPEMAARVNKPTRPALRRRGFRYQALDHANASRTAILEITRLDRSEL